MKTARHTTAAAAILLLTLLWPAVAPAQEPGQIRAMDQRARQVRTVKNRFIIRALGAHGIQYRLNPDGDVSAIKADGVWRKVSRVEVVPSLLNRWGKTVVVGHTLYFLSDGAWLSIYMTGTAW